MCTGWRTLPARMRATAYLGAGCGLRHGETIGLEVEHVDFLRREVHVMQQLTVTSGSRPHLAPLKTRTSRRTVELPRVAADALAQHWSSTRPQRSKSRTAPIRDDPGPGGPVGVHQLPRAPDSPSDVVPRLGASRTSGRAPATNGVPRAAALLRDVADLLRGVGEDGAGRTRSLDADDHPEHVGRALAGPDRSHSVTGRRSAAYPVFTRPRWR